MTISLKVLMAMMVLAGADAVADETWRSPDGRLICAAKLGKPLRGQELWVWLSNAPSSRVLVWASERWVEATWSPDSRFLAVVDRFAADESALLVFGVSFDAKTKVISTTLLFETPLKEKRKQEWELGQWKLKEGQVILIKKEGFKKSAVTAFLSDRPIEQSLYTRDPRGAAAVKKLEDDGSRR